VIDFQNKISELFIVFRKINSWEVVEEVTRYRKKIIGCRK